MASGPNYGNDPGGMRYSTVTQINRENVAKLKVAWVFHTGDIADGSDGYRRSGFETTPILVDGALYLTTPFNRVIALDPATGTQRWAYDPRIDRSLEYGDGLVKIGVAAWLDSSKSPSQPCLRRIFEATLDARLIALDSATGKWQVPIGSMKNFGAPHKDIPPGSISLGGSIATAGGLVFIAGTTDTRIRAFDATTGALLWEGQLPASGSATPMTYQIGSKQYLVIAAGGHQGIREEQLGDSLVAFALP